MRLRRTEAARFSLTAQNADCYALALNLELILPSRRVALHVLLGTLAALVPFFAILHFGLPAWFPGWITEDVLSPLPRNVAPGWPWRQCWCLAVALAVAGSFRLRGPVGRWLPLTLLLAALAMAQASIWQSGLSRFTMMGGLIPYSDAGVYTEYANHIANGHQVKYSLQDRPMFSCLLASLLLLCGGNLQWAIALLLLLAGTAMHFAARAVITSFGTAAAAIFVWVNLMFYARWIGSTMTEHLGLSLGLLGCAFLLIGWQERRERVWLAGMALLTCGLCARAGAFFVLPALIVVAAYHFAKERRFAWKLSSQSLAAVLAVMLVSRFLAFCVFDAEKFPRSNFHYTAYGVVNNSSWELAFRKYGTDHDKIRSALIKRITRHPLSVPKGMWRAWRMFFQNAYGFCFMGGTYAILLQAIVIFAFLHACWRRRPEDWLIIAICIGVGASIPFAPPADADTMRVYAATIPLHALVAGLGMRKILEALGALRRSVSVAHTVVHLRAESALAGVILFLAFAIPIVHYVYFPNRESPRGLKSTGQQPGKLAHGTYINLVADEARTRVPDVRVSDFRRQLRGFAGTFPVEAAALAQLAPGVSIVSGGFDCAIFPTAKMRDPNSTAVLQRIVVHWMKIDADTDLVLPFSGTP